MMAFGSSLLEKVLDDIYEHIFKAGSRSIEQWTDSLDLFRRGRKRYFNTINSQYGKIRILGMSRPMSIETLYVPVRISEEIRVRKYLDEQYLDYINKQKEIPSAIIKELTRIFRGEKYDIIDSIEKYNTIILLGSPGGGKTTALRYLALLFAGQLKTESEIISNPRFPILITLRDMVEKEKSLWKLILEQIEQAKIPQPKLFLERLLEKGKCILLLDGFDEVQTRKQVVLLNQMSEMVTKYPNNSYIISSRISEPLAPLESFTEIQIGEFNEEEIRKFVTNWFGDSDLSKAKDLIQKMSKDIHLKELATTPLLLSLLCILYKHDLHIPKNRGELYDRCVECLLREWDSSRGFRRETIFERLSDGRKLQLLSKIAYDFFMKDKLFFLENSLLSTVESFLERLDIERENIKKVLKEIESQHGILIERAPSVFSFSHLTFQEYFVAKYIVSLNLHRGIAKLTTDPKWQEVSALVASILPDATEFIRRIIQQINIHNLRFMASKGILGYEYKLMKTLILSDAIISTSVREQLYRIFLDHHFKVFNISWGILELNWRYSPKAGMVMVKAHFGRQPRSKFKVTDIISAFRSTLDTLAFSSSLLKYFSNNYIPANDPVAKEGFIKFTNMVSDIIEKGGNYSLKIY